MHTRSHPRRNVALLTSRVPRSGRSAVGKVVLAALVTPLVTACATSPGPAPLAPLPIPAAVADSIRTSEVAPGAWLHRLVQVKAPWRAFVLELSRACVALEAIKGRPVAVGRMPTSVLLTQAMGRQPAFAAVNADFFLPSGLPTNAHIEHGALLSGPDARPVLWSDERGRVHVDTLRVRGSIRWRDRSSGQSARRELTAWNRPASRTSGIVDAQWAAPLDSAVRTIAVRLIPLTRGIRAKGPSLRGTYTVAAAVTGDTSAWIVRGDTLLLHLARTGAAEAPVPRAGDTVQLHLQLAPGASPGAATPTGGARVMHAVGGRPRLVVDSAVTSDVDTEGNAGFRGLNPRTLLGFDRRGDRIWLIVVDGRAPGYSMGMTLRESAELLRTLGAVQGLNLDGGGSSTLALRDVTTGTVGTINRMSDGPERPVANALVAVSRCQQR